MLRETLRLQIREDRYRSAAAAAQYHGARTDFGRLARRASADAAWAPRHVVFPLASEGPLTRRTIGR